MLNPSGVYQHEFAPAMASARASREANDAPRHRLFTPDFGEAGLEFLLEARRQFTISSASAGFQLTRKFFRD